jgi:UDP-glucose:(heptosyl)LPS alpha-1,3-glucosyltransferase
MHRPAAAASPATEQSGGDKAVNLAICHPVVVPARGGCETYIADLMGRLRADGHSVHLYASRWDAPALPGGVHIHRVPETGWPRLLRPWRFSRACVDRLRRAEHDLSVAFDKVAGVDVVYPLGGLNSASLRHGLGKFPPGWRQRLAEAGAALDPVRYSFRRFERRQYVDEPRPFVIAPSGLVRRHFSEELGLSPAEVEVLHCAIPPGRFTATDRPARRAVARQGWEVGPADTVALFVAMNHRLKGLGPLLCALARLPRRERFRLAVVGSPVSGSFRRLAARLDVTGLVRFVGYCPDVRDAYFAADLLVHPTFYDPCSLVVLEALACGLPVITSRHNGAAELLDVPNDGLVVADPHDHDELARALAHFLDPALRQQAARAALRGAGKWTFEMHYQRLLALLREALRRKRAA